MKICIFDWSVGRLLAGSPYEHNQEVEGGPEDALRIAGELFRRGANVMIVHRPERNEGSKKNPVIVPKSILIQVDDQRFQQR